MKRLLRLAVIFGVGLFVVLCGGALFLNRNAPHRVPTSVPAVAAPTVSGPTIAVAPTEVPEGYMSRALMGDKWPLTVEYGWIECDGNAILFRSANGDYYAVNGSAISQAKAKGWRNIHDIDVPTPKDGAGTIISLQPLLDVGLKLCH